MKIEANAKINLTLDVVNKRADGYHELDMIMVPLTLCDTLEVTFSESDEIICDTTSFPLDESNTIYKAIVLMREKYQLTQHFKVNVKKCIPMQAGLAGGSADGAAMLKAIVQMCHIQISEEELLLVAKQIGADVPFCVINEASRVQGIGEKVTRFPILDDIYVLLVKPKEGVSTKEAFANVDFATCVHPDVENAQKALMQQDYTKFCASIGNTLEQSAMQLVPAIQDIKTSLLSEGVDCALMSGSGSTVFALSKKEEVLQTIALQYKEQYDFVCCCKIKKG